MRALLLLVCVFFSCSESSLPKPKGFLALKYPIAQYNSFQTDCDFHFLVNRSAQIEFSDACNVEIYYPEMKATFFITHFDVNNNLNTLLEDVQKKLEEQSLGSTRIQQSAFEDPNRRVFGSMFTVEADVASNLQFFVTDQQRNFISGSLYIKARPNYDSIIPTIEYLKKDVKKLIQTFEWKEVN